MLFTLIKTREIEKKESYSTAGIRLIYNLYLFDDDDE